MRDEPFTDEQALALAREVYPEAENTSEADLAAIEGSIQTLIGPPRAWPNGQPPEFFAAVMALCAEVRRLRIGLGREIADERMYADHCSHVYDEISRGHISKPNTRPEEVIMIYERLQNEDFAEWLEEGFARNYPNWRPEQIEAAHAAFTEGRFAEWWRQHAA